MISEAELKETAAIAQLSLDPAEVETLREQLQVMIDYFAMLDLPDEPSADEDVVSRTVTLDDCRSDEVRLPAERVAVQAAPDFTEDFFFVPRVLG